jgi:hypothetical protein
MKGSPALALEVDYGVCAAPPELDCLFSRPPSRELDVSNAASSGSGTNAGRLRRD